MPLHTLLVSVLLLIDRSFGSQTEVIHMELNGGPAVLWSQNISIDGLWHIIDTKGQAASQGELTWSSIIQNVTCCYRDNVSIGAQHVAVGGVSFNIGPPSIITAAKCAYNDIESTCT